MDALRLFNNKVDKENDWPKSFQRDTSDFANNQYRT